MFLSGLRHPLSGGVRVPCRHVRVLLLRVPQLRSQQRNQQMGQRVCDAE